MRLWLAQVVGVCEHESGLATSEGIVPLALVTSEGNVPPWRFRKEHPFVIWRFCENFPQVSFLALQFLQTKTMS